MKEREAINIVTMFHATLLIAVTPLATSLSYPAHSQEMIPLEKALVDSSPGYFPTRCAALFNALLAWIGEERMGEEKWISMNSAVTFLMEVAEAVIQENMKASPEAARNIVVRDTANIRDLYIERMKRNYAAQGQAFGRDSLFLSDLQLCKLLLS